MPNTTDLIRVIEEGVWSDVLAMPVQSSQVNLLDIVFKTDKGNVRITGKENDIGGEEWFSLNFLVFKERGWWDLSNEENNWEFINFSELLVSSGIKELSKPPRSLYFYTNEAFSKAHENDEGSRERCTAVEIRKNVADRELRLLIAASQDNLFTVSLVWDKDKINFMLDEMIAL